MYITQTYLGFISKKAKAYVYFLSEQYMSDRQSDLHDVFLNRAKEFGLSTGPEVAVVLPLPGFEIKVLGDINDEPNSLLQKFYVEKIRDNLPGLLVTRVPLDTKKCISGAVFFSFNEVEHPFRAAKALVNEITTESEDGIFLKLLSGLNEVVILQPNVYGIGININAIIEKVSGRLKK